MPRGGKRQGTPGKGYTNRTDLSTNYMPGSAANGGVKPPAQPAAPQAAPTQPQVPAGLPLVGADQVPNIGDPTMRPNEPVTAGIGAGPGPGPEIIGPLPPSPADPIRQVLQAMMLVDPNADIVRLMNRLEYEGR